VLAGSLCALTSRNNEEHLEQPHYTARGRRLYNGWWNRVGTKMVPRWYQDGTKMCWCYDTVLVLTLPTRNAPPLEQEANSTRSRLFPRDVAHMDAFGAPRVKVKPPERGIFPLDHEGECKQSMQSFLGCLKANQQDHYPCREYSKAYLQCRMDNNLMAKEDMKSLGLDTNSEYVRVQKPEGEKESKGFIAGLGVKAGKGWWQ
jgi:cytochrome c oxidase assembly protein subunit 19